MPITCPCRDLPCHSAYQRARLIVDGHHPECGHVAIRGVAGYDPLIAGLLSRLDAAERERDALLARLVGSWPAGGWVVSAVVLQYQSEPYPGGRWFGSERHADPGWWWFERREDAVRALYATGGA